MIVVIGQPLAIPSGPAVAAGGLAGGVARTAVAAGSIVQLVARIADDPAGDAIIHALAAAGVGHVATLRQPPGPETPRLDPADLDLALHYLGGIGVIVLTDGSAEGIRAVATDAASWERSALIVIMPPGSPPASDLPPEAIVLEGPRSDPDAAFAGFVGTLAAALDRGDDPTRAFQSALQTTGGWSPGASD